jgi:hypothetical protein
VVGAFELERRLDDFQHRLDFGVGFLGQRFLEQRQHRVLGAAGEFFGGGKPDHAVRRNQLERGKRCRKFAAQAVVGVYVFAFGGQRVDFLPGQRVYALLAFDDQHLLAGRLQLSVGQGLQQGGRLGIAFGDQCCHGGDLLVALAESELAHDFRIQRAGGQAQRQQAEQDERISYAHQVCNLNYGVIKQRRRFRAAACIDTNLFLLRR